MIKQLHMILVMIVSLFSIVPCQASIISKVIDKVRVAISADHGTQIIQTYLKNPKRLENQLIGHSYGIDEADRVEVDAVVALQRYFDRYGWQHADRLRKDFAGDAAALHLISEVELAHHVFAPSNNFDTQPVAHQDGAVVRSAKYASEESDRVDEDQASKGWLERIKNSCWSSEKSN